jgi:hypothetical protein
LRPHREPIRVEQEIWQHQKSKKKTIVIQKLKTVPQKIVLNHFFLKIIHNYGHGGNGIALSRGTAVHAVELLLDSISVTDKLKSNL